MIDVGILEHDHRRMAAELHRHPLHVLAGQRRKLLADRGRAGEGDLADDRMRDQILRDLRRHAVDQVDHAGRHAGIGEARISSAGDAGVSSGALTMIEQPAASAAEILRTTWLIGKFHGVKAATGPTGSLTRAGRRPGRAPG